tara:strand:+ start:225 stop:446 length:222 start_codon:yes stop_codon:yes gene_type:complete
MGLRESLLKSMWDNVEKVGLKKETKYYKKELYEAVAHIITLEYEHKKKGKHIKKDITAIVERLGTFLKKNANQ